MNSQHFIVHNPKALLRISVWVAQLQWMLWKLWSAPERLWKFLSWGQVRITRWPVKLISSPICPMFWRFLNWITSSRSMSSGHLGNLAVVLILLLEMIFHQDAPPPPPKKTLPPGSFENWIFFGVFLVMLGWFLKPFRRHRTRLTSTFGGTSMYQAEFGWLEPCGERPRERR